MTRIQLVTSLFSLLTPHSRLMTAQVCLSIQILIFSLHPFIAPFSIPYLPCCSSFSWVVFYEQTNLILSFLFWSNEWFAQLFFRFLVLPIKPFFASFFKSLSNFQIQRLGTLDLNLNRMLSLKGGIWDHHVNWLMSIFVFGRQERDWGTRSCPFQGFLKVIYSGLFPFLLLCVGLSSSMSLYHRDAVALSQSITLNILLCFFRVHHG